jgi:ABC-type oligopeptide transport system substrate-binding subunit
VNASGYSNAEFDRACKNAIFSLPDSSIHRDAHHQAQAIFTEDLPSIPLFWRFKVVVARADMCAVSIESSGETTLSGLEEYDYAESCE